MSPIILTETTLNTDDRREKMLELLFEKFETNAAFIAKDSVLSSFAVGRHTSLIFDSGHGKTSVVPVHNGYAILGGAFFKLMHVADLMQTVLFCISVCDQTHILSIFWKTFVADFRFWNGKTSVVPVHNDNAILGGALCE